MEALICGLIPPDLGAARVDDDQLGTPCATAFSSGWQRPGGHQRVRADHHHHIGMLDRIEILRACTCAKGLAKPIAGWRMASDPDPVRILAVVLNLMGKTCPPISKVSRSCILPGAKPPP
jgi:hypothetical protein